MWLAYFSFINCTPFLIHEFHADNCTIQIWIENTMWPIKNRHGRNHIQVLRPHITNSSRVNVLYLIWKIQAELTQDLSQRFYVLFHLSCFLRLCFFLTIWSNKSDHDAPPLWYRCWEKKGHHKYQHDNIILLIVHRLFSKSCIGRLSSEILPPTQTYSLERIEKRVEIPVGATGTAHKTGLDLKKN